MRVAGREGGSVCLWVGLAQLNPTPDSDTAQVLQDRAFRADASGVNVVQSTRTSPPVEMPWGTGCHQAQPHWTVNAGRARSRP